MGRRRLRDLGYLRPGSPVLCEKAKYTWAVAASRSEMRLRLGIEGTV